MLGPGARTTAWNVHDAWAAATALRDPGHPWLVPFELLPDARRADCERVAEAIRHAAREFDAR